jgi:hypothetical protein
MTPDARHERRHNGDVLDLIGTRSKTRNRQVCRGPHGSEPVRRHIRHKHLREHNYGFEKIFREAERSLMTES